MLSHAAQELHQALQEKDYYDCKTHEGRQGPHLCAIHIHGTCGHSYSLQLILNLLLCRTTQHRERLRGSSSTHPPAKHQRQEGYLWLKWLKSDDAKRGVQKHVENVVSAW